MHDKDANHPLFEPSLTTKDTWRFTRKMRVDHASVRLPGLFRTDGFVWDAVGFMAVIGLELWGLANLLIVGQIQFIFVAGLFLADVVFAILAHLPKGLVCELESRKLVTLEATEKVLCERQIGRRRVTSLFFYGLIVVIAASKVVGFYGLQGGSADMLTVTILVSYALAATLHIVCTGHFAFAVATTVLWRRDFSAYIANPPDGLVRLQHHFDAGVAMQDAKTGLQSLSADANNRYVLQTTGLFHDTELASLIHQQATPAAKRELTLEGRKHQLVILQNQSVPGPAPTGKAGVAAAGVVALLALVLGGCAEPAKKSEKQTFSMQILLTDAPGEKGEHLPAELIEIAAPPLTADDCPNVIFAPQPVLIRLDRDEPLLVPVVHRSHWTDPIRRAFGGPDTPQQLDVANRRDLQGLEISADLAGPGTGERDPDALRAVVGTDSLWTQGSRPDWLAESDTRVLSDLVEFRSQVAADLCSRHKEGTKALVQSVLYQPPGTRSTLHVAANAPPPKPAPADRDQPAPVVDHMPTADRSGGLVPQGDSTDLSGPIQRIRDDLEHGRLLEAKASLDSLLGLHPHHDQLSRLADQVTAPVKSRIELKLTDGPASQRVIDSPKANITLSGKESGLRLYVEAHETIHAYVFARSGDGSIRQLFPEVGSDSGSLIMTNRALWLPSEDGRYPLDSSPGRPVTVYAVTSRWPVAILSSARTQSSDAVLEALGKLAEPGLGSCDVRTVELDAPQSIPEA